MNKWVKNDPVRLFSCNVFVIISCYYFIFQTFLKNMFLISCLLKFLLLYILRNCRFCKTTPGFCKWIKNDPHAFPMESYENLWFLSTVAVRDIFYCQPQRLYQKCHLSGGSLYTARSDRWKFYLYFFMSKSIWRDETVKGLIQTTFECVGLHSLT